jgi:hypothetical protein
LPTYWRRFLIAHKPIIDAAGVGAHRPNELDLC